MRLSHPGASLRNRLFLGHALLLALALATVTAIETRGQRDWILSRDREALERTAHHLVFDLPSAGPAAPGAAPDWPDWAGRKARGLGARITLIDSTGRVIGDSEVPREELPTLENHATRPEVRRALAGNPGWAVRHSASIGVDLLYVAVPAGRMGAGNPAVVRVAEPLANISRVNTSLLRLSFAAMALTLAGMALLLFWFTGRHAGRIRDLEEAAARLGADSPAPRASELPEDSLGRLGRAINSMAGELKSRLHAIEQERDERDLILAHMSDGVALLDRDGLVLHMNHRLAAILGATRPADPGTPFPEFVRSPELDDLLKRARLGTSPVETDLRLWSPQLRLVRATASPLRASSAGVLLVLHDLTEAETLNRVRQDFVANVSHELRTPLTSLRGYAETLLEGGLDDAAHREGFVRVIRDQTLRLQALVSDLLSLAELERPEARLNWETFDLREAVERQMGAFRPAARRTGLALEIEPGPAEIVRADRPRIDQVLANLLDNAVKYTERGEVRVRLGGDESRVWCEVSDTGHGIPPGDRARIFERFYRVDKGRSREQGGTGLGLSIVKHILALHRGDVTVRVNAGPGSTFRFEFPRVPVVRAS